MRRLIIDVTILNLNMVSCLHATFFHSDFDIEGTRTFQSVIILRSQMNLPTHIITPTHDYLDDLESFFLRCMLDLLRLRWARQVEIPTAGFLCVGKDSRPMIANALQCLS